MFGFFVMGFVDIVGITTSYVKNDFSHLTDTMVNLISLSCFLWFLVLSIPTGIRYNHGTYSAGRLDDGNSLR